MNKENVEFFRENIEMDTWEHSYLYLLYICTNDEIRQTFDSMCVYDIDSMFIH